MGFGDTGAAIQMQCPLLDAVAPGSTRIFYYLTAAVSEPHKNALNSMAITVHCSVTFHPFLAISGI